MKLDIKKLMTWGAIIVAGAMAMWDEFENQKREDKIERLEKAYERLTGKKL